MINLETESFAETLYFSGTYTRDIGDNDEVIQVSHDFTLCVMMEDDTDRLEMEVTWIDKEPNNSEEIEKEIKKIYLKR